jgi:MoaA/NifB/PqqE/SkfB family radical SAM enzyme
MTLSARLETLCYRITQHCNLACNHCRSGSSPATRLYSRTDLFLEFARKAKDELGLRHVSISGGEPSLDDRLCDTIVDLVSMGLFVSVTTNGTAPIGRLLSSTIGRYSERVRIRVSIDGPERVHDAIRGRGTFVQAVRNAHRVREQMGWLGMNTVATPDLMPLARELAEIAISCSVSEWALITPVPQGSALGRPWFPETLAPTAEALRAAISNAGFSNRIVVWDFISTPETSILVEANGDIVLSGLGDDNRLVTTISECDINSLSQAIVRAECENDSTHFRWKGWR